MCVCLSLSLSATQIRAFPLLGFAAKSSTKFSQQIYNSNKRKLPLSPPLSLSFRSLLQQIKLSLEENVIYNRGQESNIIYHPRPQTTKKKVFKFLAHMSVMGVCVCVCVWKVPIISCECIGCLCICVWEGFM